MPLNFIQHNGNKYPDWQGRGNAARWIMPLAQYIIDTERMVGYDIGYSKEAWMLPGAIGIEPSIDPKYDAMKLPAGEVDYIFSSHCLEHVQRNWYDVLDYWLSKIRVGGTLFLYLPHSSQTYWHPSSNRKHIHSFDGSEIETYLNDLGHKVYVSGCDWDHSFVVVCEKVKNIINGEDLINNTIKNAIDIAQKETDVAYDVALMHFGKTINPFPEVSTNDRSSLYEKPSFTRVTADNQKHFPDIPIGHYVTDSLAGQNKTLSHQNMNETRMKGMYYTYCKTPMPDEFVNQYNEGLSKKENDTPIEFYKDWADKCGRYWASKCAAL